MLFFNRKPISGNTTHLQPNNKILISNCIALGSSTCILSISINLSLSFVLTAAILVYAYLQLKYSLCTSDRNQHA